MTPGLPWICLDDWHLKIVEEKDADIWEIEGEQELETCFSCRGLSCHSSAPEAPTSALLTANQPGEAQLNGVRHREEERGGVALNTERSTDAGKQEKERSQAMLAARKRKQFTSSGIDKLFSTKNNTHLKMYKPPIMLNEVLVKLPDPSSDDPVFHVSHIDTVYILRTENINERTAWVQKIKAASEESLQKEKKTRDRAFHSRSLKGTGMGRLLVTVLEASELKAVRSNGKMNPYCEVTLGSQVFTSRTLNDTTYPKWNFNCQFQIKDIYQDVLSITIYERDPFAPDDFLGRTEVPMANIKKELESKGGGARRLVLQEVSSGEVWVRFDLQLFNGK